MKVLQLTKKFPYPLLDGESWAVIGMATGLKLNGAQIDLFSLNTDKHEIGNEIVERLESLELYGEIISVDVKAKPNLLTGLINLFSKISYHAVRFDHSYVKERLHHYLSTGKYDVILVESVFMMNSIVGIPAVTRNQVKVVLRAHNLEHLIWERYARRLGQIKSWYFNDQSKRLRQFECEMIQKCDGLLSVSANDTDEFKKRFQITKPLLTAPIAMDPLKDDPRIHGDAPFLFGFIGSLDWRPNLEGLNWFIKEVWPQILEVDTTAVLLIAGRNAGDDIQISDHGNITILGEIEDSDTFMKRIDVLISPLWSGSGTRVKILQALRTGTPVIGSDIAYEGLKITDREEVLIANSTAEYVEAFNLLLKEDDLRNTLSQKGKKYLTKYHDTNNIGKEVIQFIKDL